tara:strand:- start:23030 stop:23443 length:414 start_codon:yes stop_codon:yes gene_type:complete
MKMKQTRKSTSNTVVSKNIYDLAASYGMSAPRIAEVMGVSEQLVYNAIAGHPVGRVNDRCAEFYAEVLDLKQALNNSKSASASGELERENNLQAAKIADQLATITNLRSELIDRRAERQERATVITALTKYMARGDK